jgi:hypothetical protein
MSTDLILPAGPWRSASTVFSLRLGKLILLATLVLLGCLKNGGNTPIPGIKGKNPRQAIYAEQSWSGEMPTETRLALREEAFAVSSQDEWQKVWKQVRGNEPTPSVDFNDLVVIVIINSDSSKFELTFFRDFDGELLYNLTPSPAEKINSKVCSYIISTLKRDGIRSFNGKVLDVAKQK